MHRRMSREEWNAAYFLGLEDVIRDHQPLTLNEQLAAGVRRLEEWGHALPERRSPAEMSGEASSKPPVPSAHGGACRELTQGSFDTVHRAREALDWLKKHLPEVPRHWIESLLHRYEELHPSPTGPLHNIGSEEE